MKTFTKLFINTFLFVLFTGYIYSQDIPSREYNSKLSAAKPGSINYTTVNGTIFKTINLITNRVPLGVTVVNSQIIVSSTDNNGSNYFDVYDMSGNYISSTLQSTTSQYGYRDLAFDGTYILASDDSTIKKIDPNTFQVVSQITNGGNSPHRGLAYDPNENVIYSSNWRWHNILKIDPATGATIKTLNKPTQNVYGLAIDYFSNPNYASLWFAEPTSYSAFRLSRADTSFTRINFTYDLTAATPDSALSGGLEIINNYPGYADSVIALIIDQKNKALNLINITGAPQTFPASLELVGEFQGFDAAGIITTGMVQYDNYLYSVDNQNLAIYEITTNPAIPTFVKSVTVPNGNRIFLEGNFGNNIIVTTKNAGQYGFAAFSLADPLNPQLESWTGTTNPIIAMDVGYYSYVLEEGLNKLLVYDMGNFTAPVLNNSYNLQGEGISLAKDPGKNLLFVGTKGNGLQDGFQVFDYSNPNTLVEKYHTSFIGDYPQRIVALPSVNKIIIGANSTTTGSLIKSYDYSDPTNLVFKKLQFTSSTKGIWDMKLIDGMIVVTVPEDGKFLTYKWDDASNMFLMGPSADLAEPIDIIDYLPPSNPQNIKEYNSTFGGTTQDRYFYIPNGYANGPIVAGSEKTSIIKTKQPPAPPAGKVNLTMHLNPSNAAAHGVSIIPASGVHQYDIGAGVNLYATPNEADGWYFTGWTGDASGTGLIAHITMDKDKNVTANFGELLLTVSGKKDPVVYFPSEIEKNAQLFKLPITVSASTLDDWDLQKISLRTRGNGDELNDISKVEIFLGNSLKYSGTFTVDDGEIDATFNPTIPIGAGQSILLNLIYTFQFDPQTYATDTTKSFHVETFGTTAKPVHYPSGLIAGSAKHEDLTFAKVKNTQGYGFTKIQKAVEAVTTRDGDSVLVGPGEYIENVEVFDLLVIIAVDGPGKTKIYPAVTDEPVFNLNNTDYCEINGFYISSNTIYEIQNGISVFDGSNNKIIGNIFEKNVIGIKSIITDSTIIKDNTFKNDVDLVTESFIKLSGARHNVVHNNIFGFVTDHAHSIWSRSGDNNSFGGNISSGNGIMLIELNKEKNSRLFNNKSPGLNEQTRLSPKFGRIDLDQADNITFDGNVNIDVHLKNSFDNFILDNELGDIILSGFNNNIQIKYNSLHDGEFGIMILTENSFLNSNNTLIVGNEFTGSNSRGITTFDTRNTVIKGNDIGLIDGASIIISSGENTKIIDNDIYRDNGNGIVLISSTNILVQFNHVWSNASAGLYLNDINGGRVIGNTFQNNQTGIVSKNINNVYFKANKIINNNGGSTGLHADFSNMTVTGNQIYSNNGGGIKIGNATVADINFNNIFSNSNVQVENIDNSVTLDVTNNYWGRSTGPIAGDIAGNFLMNGYLTKPVSLVISASEDTLHAALGTQDSVEVFVNNFINPNDNVQVSVVDDKGWVTSINNLQLQLLQDSTGYELPVKYNVPTNAQTNEISTVNYSVTSTSDSNTVFGIFYIGTYSQNLTTLLINSDSLTIEFGQSVQFNAVGFDQNVNPVGVSPLWSTNKGIISQTGLLVSDSTTGEGIITLRDQATGMQASAHFYNSDQAAVLNKISINPDSVILNSFNGFIFRAKGYNQFNYPKDFVHVWNSSGGTIDNIGFFTPDSVNSQYIITVSDTSNTFIDSAVVIMDRITGVDDVAIIPQKYSLSQNYPNPFNPATTIRFTLSEPSFVKLEVFNILGQRVMIPVDSYLNAGTYNKVLNFNKYASGVYFYRLIVKGKFIDVKKLILLK